MKNLIIDGQILQTDAWHRGMGKYTLQVLHALSENIPHGLKVHLIFNTNLKTENTRFETIDFLCPNIEQIHRALPVPTNKNSTSNSYAKKLQAMINELFADDNNYYFLTALFYFDFFAEFPDNCQKLILIYDLTPLLFWQELGGYFPQKLYMQRFQRILEADTIFAISETTKKDIVSTFGLRAAKVININGGFTKIAESIKKPISFKVPSEYILFPTGDLPHKNNRLAVKGFEQYYQSANKKLPLLITSQFQTESKEQLMAISEHIIFTDHITDEELEWLYQHANAILFASKYEGLGMPILDAVASHKAIITSRIAVFEEMSRTAFYYFNPLDHRDLAASLNKAVTHQAFTSKQKIYSTILKKYTWQKTCQALLEHLQLPVAIKENEPTHSKPNVAMVCLHPGISHQLGRSAEALHFSLSQVFNIEYYFDSDIYFYREMQRPTFLDFINTKSNDIQKLTIKSYKRYDMVIYLLDDQALFTRVGQRAAVLPGVAITNLAAEPTSLLKEIILDNQYAVHHLASKDYEAYQKITDLLQLDRQSIISQPSRAMTIIKTGYSRHAIIKKLKSHDS